MTENERLTIDEIIQHCNITCENTEMLAIARGQNQEDITSKGYWEHYQVANYLEELKQYRAIGTVERFEQLSKQFAPHNVEETSCHLRQCNKCDMYRKENEKYHEIGTIDEFKALKEKNEPKKILYRKQSYGTPWLCPYCEADQIKVEFFSEDGSEPKEKYTFCWQCGTRIDWSE